MNICKINIEEKNYELCLVRDSIKWLEARGISINDIDARPVTFVDGMWTALFVKNYADKTEAECIDLLNKYKDENGDVGEVIRFGIEEYTAFLNALNGTKSKKIKKAQITKA